MYTFTVKFDSIKIRDKSKIKLKYIIGATASQFPQSSKAYTFLIGL